MVTSFNTSIRWRLLLIQVGDQKGKKLLEKHIEDVYYDLIYSEIYKFYKENETFLALKTSNVPSPGHIKLEEITVAQIKFWDYIFQEKTEFKLRVRADFLLKGDKSFDCEYDSLYHRFVVTCNASFSNGLSDFKVINVEEHITQEYEYKKGLSDFSIPYITQNDLEKRATDFLKWTQCQGHCKKE